MLQGLLLAAPQETTEMRTPYHPHRTEGDYLLAQARLETEQNPPAPAPRRNGRFQPWRWLLTARRMALLNPIKS